MAIPIWTSASAPTASQMNSSSAPVAVSFTSGLTQRSMEWSPAGYVIGYRKVGEVAADMTVRDGWDMTAGGARRTLK